jgi:hypothetical protein
MSGYVASARITRGAPRLVRPDRALDPAREVTHVAATPTPAEPVIVDSMVDPGALAATLAVRRDRLADRAAAFRERWSQLTFFLFDPNSWR